jgi:serine/threonine protein kinase
MEYLEGINLEQLVAKHGPQKPGRVIHILSQVCSALSEAHGAGLIHRDIKPANVHLCNRGDVPDMVKVLDFGLVRKIEGDSELTATGISGTPAYMSPEAVKTPQEIGPASDLYAVGALGYFLITGHSVFKAANVIEMCVQHVQSEPIPPSQRTSNSIPPALEALILRCLQKDPGRHRILGNPRGATHRHRRSKGPHRYRLLAAQNSETISIALSVVSSDTGIRTNDNVPSRTLTPLYVLRRGPPSENAQPPVAA